MTKYLKIFTCLLILGFLYLPANSYTVTTVKNVPANNAYDTGNIYNNDLCRIERYLFGKVYTSQSCKLRLNRIENKLFNKTFSTMTIAQRMNNVLANYTGENYAQRNYYNYTNSAYRTTSGKNKLLSKFAGHPTGFTPALTSPYVNRFGPSYNRGFYGNNGWGYHNSYFPTVTGAGLHILD